MLAVTSAVSVAGGDAFSPQEPQPQWPTAAGVPRRVPLLIAGGVSGGIPAGAGLDDIAPTVAALMGIERPHPEVRSGRPLEGLSVDEPVPLVVQIVWKGVGSEELAAAPDRWPRLARIADDGAFSVDVRSPSLPLDPAAVLTTIGSGGVPAQHGITGSLVREDQGRVVTAWSRSAPVSVIAALGDDLDELTNQRARVGLVAEDVTDRGLIGADWYVRTDADDVTVEPEASRVPDLVEQLLDQGYGRDAVPDLLAVTLEGPIAQMDRMTEEIVEAVQDRVERAATVVTATGSSVRVADFAARDVARHVDSELAPAEVVEATAPGGLFLDQEVLGLEGIPEDRVISGLRRMTGAAGSRVFADVFPAIAVSFGRYC